MDPLELTELVRSEPASLGRFLESDWTLLEAVVDQMPGGLVIAEVPSGRILMTNRVWRDLFGAASTVAEIAAQGALVAVGREGTHHIPEEHPLARSVFGGEVVAGEQLEFVRRDGRRAVLEVNATPVRNARGEITSAVATFSDTTSRRRAETLLEDHRRILELIAADAPLEESLGALVKMIEAHAEDEILGSILLMDRGSEHLRHGAAPSLPGAYNDAVDGIAIGPSAGSCGTAAFTGEEVVVTDIETDPLWIDYRDLALSHGLRACWSTPVISTGGEVLGTFAMYFLEVRPPGPQHEELLRLGVRTAAVAIERTRLEQDRVELLKRERSARRSAEARAQAAISLEYIGEGVCLLDTRGRVRLWNPAAELILGITAGSIVGQPIVTAVPDWDAVFAQARAANERAVSVTVPIQRGSTELWLSMTVVAFDGGTVCAFRDVTAEREVQAVRADIVATVSHELRTPLATVYGAAKTLQKIGLGEPESQLLLDALEGQAERLRVLIEEILLASQLESGARIRLNIRPVDVVAVARWVIANAELPRATSIRVEAPPGPACVDADEERVRQVLTNLVDNAVKYGGADGEIVVSVEPLEHSIRLGVRDDGPGIPLGERERIFDKFYRLDPDHAYGVGGTGLGLYICRELVERMRGRLEVESVEGSGSTFVVELPRTAPAIG